MIKAYMAKNVFQYANITEYNWMQNLGDMTDWRPKYTFYSDFSIAEFCEVYKADHGAVKDTYERVIESWGSSYEALTEIVMVLNHKWWSFHDGVDSSYLGCSEENRQTLADLYGRLYAMAEGEFMTRFESNEDAMSYYYQVTD